MQVESWRHQACRVMTNGDREGRIFLSNSHTNNVIFFLFTIKSTCYAFKKRLPKEIRQDTTWHDAVILTQQWRHLKDYARTFQYNQWTAVGMPRDAKWRSLGRIFYPILTLMIYSYNPATYMYSLTFRLL